MSRLSHWFDGPFFPLSPWRVFKKSLMIEGDKINMPSTLGSDALTSPPHQRARGLWSPVRRRPCAPAPAVPLRQGEDSGCQAGGAPWGRRRCPIRVTWTTSPVSRDGLCTRHWPR